MQIPTTEKHMKKNRAILKTLILLSLVATSNTTAENTREPRTTCTYEQVRAYCGELVLMLNTGEDEFRTHARKISEKMQAHRGVIIAGQADLSRVIMRFPADMDLPTIRKTLQQEPGILSISYHVISQPD